MLVLIGLGLAWIAWLMWRRHLRLHEEAQRLALQHRALRNAHTRLQNQSDVLRQQAINDPLTGTLNRQAFANSLREMVEHAAHYGTAVHLIIFDLDHFKSINDQFGHLGGDRALRRVAGIVHEHIDSADLFGRFGGDEFLIACAGQLPAEIHALAEAIRAGVERGTDRRAPGQPSLTLSMGIACSGGEDGSSADTLFARADAALYEAKRQGRNRIVIADSEPPGQPSPENLGRHL